ncbi:FTSH1, partial [Symbiodinium necroappetens]
EAGQLHNMTAAGGSAAVMGAVAALGPRRAAKRSRQTVATRAAQKSPEGLSELVGLAEQLVHRPGSQQLSLLVQQLQSFASAELQRGAALSAPAARAFEEVVQGANEALVSSADKQLKWAAGAAASLLLTFSVTLQPAFAADVVNYSDFMESVNRGDVEMVRVQDDQLSAQYTTKDGARKEVNLIPNAQIEDQLFNTLAQKKVDVLGKSKARIIKDGDTKVKFADVAGCDGAKQELVEVVDFLKNTSRYSELGAKIPKGALLVGPPGTGKTLLAKAVAGEAGVPFFSISASEFVEIFAGIGASRVRDLFDQAKKSAPCIIFIDEIDAVGRQRSAGFGQGNDEREQTVNQLLTEMDGFEANKGVVTPGMSGADLANLLNEGAIVAARQNKAEIDSDDIFNALERISIGLEKKDAVMSDQKKKLVAYHEAGHAILGALMNDYDVVAKISIVPRGPAGGVTIFMPSEDRLNSGLYSKEFLENRMCVALGGRLAEEIINGKDNVTTGASNDFQQCTQVAKQMVMTLGMSPEIGQRLLGGQQGGGPFMGRDFMGQGAPPMSQALKQKVDGEIKRIVDEQYQRGMKLLRDNMYLLDGLAKLLLEEEKVSGEQLMKLINKAAAEGKLVMGNSKMAVAAYTGEVIENSSEVSLPRKTQCVHPDKPMMFACADCPRRGFCGSTRAAPRDGKAARSAVARLGLATPEAESRESTSEEVLRRIKGMAAEVSPSGAALPESVVKNAAVQALAVLAASAGPLAAKADDVPALQSMGTPQMQMQQPGGGAQRVSGRVTYSRLLEFVDEGSVKRVDFYDLGRTAVATVTVAGREQQLVCDLPGATTGLIEKLTTKGISIEVHQPEKPNPIFNVLGDVAFPLLLIAGLLFLRSRAPGGGGIPGFGNQGQAKIMITPETGVKFEDVAGIDEAKEELMEIVDFLK